MAGNAVCRARHCPAQPEVSVDFSSSIRILVRWFDHRLSDAYHIYVFNDSPECILRLQDSWAPHLMQFDHLTVQKGEPILAIHLWAEHLPPISQPGQSISPDKRLISTGKLPASSDFTWAVKTQRRFVGSLRLAAAYLNERGSLGEYRAVFAVTSLFSPDKGSGSAHPMERLGFKVVPYHSPWGGFGDFWENFYALGLIWAYNPASVQGRNVGDLKRAEMWMAIDEFMARYG